MTATYFAIFYIAIPLIALSLGVSLLRLTGYILFTGFPHLEDRWLFGIVCIVLWCAYSIGLGYAYDMKCRYAPRIRFNVTATPTNEPQPGPVEQAGE